MSSRGYGADLYARASALGLEGVVSKRADAPYRSGRSEAWIKVKCLLRERFVVVGFAPEGCAGIAKLRLARRAGCALVYVGRVGTGWDHKTARAIRKALKPLAKQHSRRGVDRLVQMNAHNDMPRTDDDGEHRQSAPGG